MRSRSRVRPTGRVGQDRPSYIQFRIAPIRQLWNPEINEYKKLDPPRRTAKIYVFCVLGRKSDLHPDPLDLGQWMFYVPVTTSAPSRTAMLALEKPPLIWSAFPGAQASPLPLTSPTP